MMRWLPVPGFPDYEVSDANTRVYRRRRYCRTCARIHSNAYKRARRDGIHSIPTGSNQ